MRKFAVTLLLGIMCITAWSQQQKIDSFRRVLAAAKDDTSRVLALGHLSYYYSSSKPDSTLLLAQQGLQLAKTVQFLKGEANCLRYMSYTFNVTGNYPKALSFGFEALKIAEKIGDQRAIESSLHTIGLIYTNEGEYRQCIQYTIRAKNVAEAMHNARELCVTLMNIGDAYEKLNMLDSALIYTRFSYKSYKDIDFNAGAWNNLGNIYSKMQALDTAMYWYRKAVPGEKQAEDDDGLCETTLGMAKIFQQKGQPDSALYYARQSIAAGRRGGFTPRVLNASQFLTAYFKKNGQVDSAYRYLEVSVAAKDSMFSEEKSREIQSLSFAERQRQLDIQQQQAAYRASVRYYLLTAVIVFLIVLAIVFWRNNKQNKKAKTQIQHTLEELKTTQNQLVQSAKMASLGELTAGIAHEIQNPLNFVNNFSEVNTELIVEMKQEIEKGDLEEVRSIANDILENQRKINHHGKRADFIVKGMMEHSRASTGERQLTNINILADEFLKLSYHGLRAKDKNFNAELVTHFDEKLPKINVAQQDIGRVLINLFGNAFYAVNQKTKTAGPDYKPMVEVSTAQQNGSVLISVKDNGTGIPENIREKIMQPFFTTKPTGEGTGLGLSLSYDIVVKGHGGKINVDAREGEYTEFIVTIPAT